MQSLDKRIKGAANENLRKIYNSPIYIPKRGGRVKKHSCLNLEAKSEASLKADSLPSRPATRRNPIITAKKTLPPRSCSVGPPSKIDNMFNFKQRKRSSSTRSTNSENQNANLMLDLQKENPKSPTESAPSSKRTQSEKNSKNASPEKSPKSPNNNKFFKESSEEHEYLLFLLRITEDIIVNDFYSNNDIKQVFRFHIEANKGRLNMRKMHLHIGNLCKELNIECKDYEIPEIEELNSPGKFKNSPQSRVYLNNEAFLKCQDCSNIRTSPLYTSQFGERMSDSKISFSTTELNMDATISPSLLKLLDKLSLGRVTECTEPAPSTSTMNSPNFRMSSNFGKEESKIFEFSEESPMDFDTFVKELNSEENMKKSNNITNEVALPSKDIIALESPPIEIYTTLIKDNPLENTDLQENQTSPSSPKVLFPNLLATPKLEDGGSKSEIELSEKDLRSLSNSEKYRSEFEKFSSSNSVSQSDKSDEEKAENVGKKQECDDEVSLVKVVTAPTINLEDDIKKTEKMIKSDVESNVLVEKNQSSEKPFSLETNESKDKNLLLPLNFPISNKSSSVSDTKEENHVTEKITKAAENPIIQNEPDKMLIDVSTSNKAASHIKNIDDNESIINKSLQATSRISAKQSEEQKGKSKVSELSETQYNEKQDTILKVILQGSLDDSDYVMVKGPVYIYKPLLESDPKLVVFDNKNNQNSRRNSVDSQHSNRTFTVDNSHVQEQPDVNQRVEHDKVDDTIPFDISLHSLEVDISMENILELSRRAYSQFNDSKLLLSDYDLTPQKDSTGSDKYHHLMMDATTSISGVNIKESLLLGDNYLVKTDENPEKFSNNIFDAEAVKVAEDNIPKDIDNYLKFEPKLYENDYVIYSQRNLTSSVSMPKLKLNESKPTSNNSRERLCNSSGGKENLLGSDSRHNKDKGSTDLIQFDVPSQDSSLRSEGETCHHIDKVNSGIPWSSYLN